MSFIWWIIWNDVDTELDIVVFYIRYLSFSKEPYYIYFFIHLYKKFPEESSHRKISQELYKYAKEFSQGIQAKVAYSEIENFGFNFNLGNIKSDLEAANDPYSYSDRLIDMIQIPVPHESFNLVLEVIRNLALIGKYKLGSILVAKLYNTPSNKGSELIYWHNFFLAIDLLIKYLSARYENPSIYSNKLPTHQIFESLQRLDHNPTLITERNNDKCKHLAQQLVKNLEEVSGIEYKAFPFSPYSPLEILKFKEKWWHITLFWLIDVYKELKENGKLHELKQLIFSTWNNQFVEDIRISLVKFINTEDRLR